MVSVVCYVSTAPTTTAAGCPYLDHPSPQTCPFLHLHVISRKRPTTHRAHRHRKNYSLSDFPISLNHFYLQLQHCIKKADKNHPTSHWGSWTQDHCECLPSQWITPVALELTRKNNLWVKTFGLSFHIHEETFWCSQRSSCYFKGVISLWGSAK